MCSTLCAHRHLTTRTATRPLGRAYGSSSSSLSKVRFRLMRACWRLHSAFKYLNVLAVLERHHMDVNLKLAQFCARRNKTSSLSWNEPEKSGKQAMRLKTYQKQNPFPGPFRSGYDSSRSGVCATRTEDRRRINPTSVEVLCRWHGRMAQSHPNRRFKFTRDYDRPMARRLTEHKVPLLPDNEP